MWTCPECGRTFANRNQTHACARPGDLDRHFAGAAPHVRATFAAALATVRALGPVEVLPEQTRIALHRRMSFAAFMPRRRWLAGHLVLAREVASPRFRRVEVLSPRNVVHSFRLSSPAEMDAEFAGWLAEAYQVGAQQHLGVIGWIREIVLDTADPHRLAAFWAALLGGTPVQWYPGWVTLEPPPHGQRLSFQGVGTAAAEGSGVHFDVLVSDLDRAQRRVEALGGSWVGEHVSPRAGPGGEQVSWRVCRDPDGHAFCLVTR